VIAALMLAGALSAVPVVADAARTAQNAPGSTNAPKVDPEWLRRVREAAERGKKPCVCQHPKEGTR